MKAVTIKLKSKHNYTLKMVLAAQLAEKAIVKTHDYETELGVFRVSVNKTIQVTEL